MGRTKSHAQHLQTLMNRRRQLQIQEYARLRHIFTLRQIIAKRIARFIFTNYIVPKRRLNKKL